MPILSNGTILVSNPSQPYVPYDTGWRNHTRRQRLDTAKRLFSVWLVEYSLTLAGEMSFSSSMRRRRHLGQESDSSSSSVFSPRSWPQILLGGVSRTSPANFDRDQAQGFVRQTSNHDFQWGKRARSEADDLPVCSLGWCEFATGNVTSRSQLSTHWTNAGYW